MNFSYYWCFNINTMKNIQQVVLRKGGSFFQTILLRVEAQRLDQQNKRVTAEMKRGGLSNEAHVSLV